MPSFWGPSDEELMSAQSYQFSATADSDNPLVDQSGQDDDDSDESEVEDDEGMDDHFGHLFDLAEAAHLADVYHTGEWPLLEDVTATLHKDLTPYNSPRKCSHL